MPLSPSRRAERNSCLAAGEPFVNRLASADRRIVVAGADAAHAELEEGIAGRRDQDVAIAAGTRAASFGNLTEMEIARLLQPELLAGTRQPAVRIGGGR